MFIVDTALRRREADGRPIRVGMIGAGFMGRGVANQILNSVPGMRLVAIANRTVEKAKQAYERGGAPGAAEAETLSELENHIHAGEFVVTADFELLCMSEQIDAILELTGDVSFGATAAMSAIAAGKHFVTMNVELDATLGPVLARRAKQAGVVYSVTDGDQPGVQMNLVRFVKSIGMTPVVCGNVKGLQDPYRTPLTQKSFAEKWGQDQRKVTSFADGTKISFEQAIVANAVGMRVEKRGMVGRAYDGHVDDLTRYYDAAELHAQGGVVDYVVGAKPAPSVFVFATHDDPQQREYLNLYKLGEGPLYSFYAPYHLCHFEAPLSVARAVLFNDTVLSAPDGLRVEVVATAKTDLKAGQEIDGLGGFLTYGEAENYSVASDEGCLPMGLAEGCIMTRDLAKDTTITYDDVQLPANRLVDGLRKEQDNMMRS